MPRLIDADALPKYTGYALSADEVARAVENAPTVDAVEVVRCKDCKFWECDAIFPDGWCRGKHQGNPNWFCADGERREKCRD